MENFEAAVATAATNSSAGSSSPPPSSSSPPNAPVVISPCAACKILRRRCTYECVFAPYFPPTEPAKFAIAHRVFGASNINKFLQELPESQRADAVSSMVYEARARIRDPVYGCSRTICQLQKQVTELQSQLAKAQAELVNMQCQQENLVALLCVEMAKTPQPKSPESVDNFITSSESSHQGNLTRKFNQTSGCCKPPTACGYVYVNETLWNSGGGQTVSNPDCTKWSNDQEQLRYQCDSCKAGVLASLKKSWRKVSVINIVVLIILVIFYVIGCAAFGNNRRIDNDEAYGEARMTKAQPSRIQL